jgi:cyclase
MHRVRVIPCLLLRGRGLVKTRQFKDAVYIGDPVNSVRIFSEKEVDELIVLDIDASRRGQEPNYQLISDIAGECFMPMAYGGGIRTLNQVRRIVRSGVEKVVINSAAVQSMGVIAESAAVFGSQAIVAGVDVKRDHTGEYRVVSRSATVETKWDLYEYVEQLVAAGAGEIFLNCVDRDGMMSGYDLGLIRSVASRVSVPVVASGGAGTVEHLVEAVRDAGASAVSAGSMFVFYGRHRAVLINYPRESLFR